MKNKKRIIVFGGSGFIGSHVADLLTMKGHDVTIFDVKKSKYLLKNQKMVIGSILNEKKISKIMRGTDLVFHFAGVADIYEANINPLNAVKMNIVGTTNILNSMNKYKVPRIIFSSSIYVFSEQGGVYRTTKQACELIIENYHKLFGIKYTNLRFGSLYGPRANNFNFIKKMINEARSNNKMIRNGNGKEIRNYVNVLDVAKYCLIALNKKYINKNIEILGKEKTSIKQILNLIKSKMPNSKTISIEYTGKRDFAHYYTTPYTFKKRKFEKVFIHNQIPLVDGILNEISNKKKN